MAPRLAIPLTVALVAAFICAFVLVRLLVARLTAPSSQHAFKRAIVRLRHKVSSKPNLACFINARADRKKAQAMRAQMPEAIRLLCIAIDSGETLTRALSYAAQNCPSPLADELKRAVWDLEAGHGFDEAMEGLRKSSGSSEFAFLAVAMEVQHRCGGSMTEVLSVVSKALRDAYEMDEELMTKTTQARLSARIVALMPVVVIGLISLFSPGYLQTFFSSALGVLLLAVAFLLEAAGVIMVNRSLKIDLHSGLGRQT